MGVHYINNEDKTRQLIIRFSLYAFIGLIVFALSFILVLSARGYDIDRTTGQVISNGLLVVDSRPAAANVIINGVPENKRTPSEHPLPAGTYNIELQKNGYRPWRSTIDLAGSSVTRIPYPHLVSERVATDLVDASRPQHSLHISPSGKRVLAISDSDTAPLISYFEAGATDPLIRRVALSPVLTSSDGQFGVVKLLTWLNDDRQVLLSHRSASGTEQIILDIEDSRTVVSVTERFGRRLSKILPGSTPDTLYELNDGRLMRHDVAAQSTIVLERAVDHAIVTKQGAIVATKNGGTVLLRSVDRGDTFVRLLVDQATLMTFDVALFEGVEYIVVAHENNRAVIYQQMQDSAEAPNTPIKVIRTREPISRVRFSPSGRYVHVATDGIDNVFSIEAQKQYQISIQEPLRWIDEYRLQFIRDGYLFLLDYTGENQYKIARTDPSEYAIADSRGVLVYNLLGAQDQSDNFRLQRTNLLGADS